MSDAVYITGPIQTGYYDFCTDLNSDLEVSTEDAVIFTPYIKGGYACQRIGQ
jgi:hypothetical protein